MNKGIINISGISESRSVPIISEIIKEKGQSLIITASLQRAEKLALDLSFFSDREIRVMPEEERIFLKYDAKNHDQMLSRLKILKTLRTDGRAVIVAPVSAVIKRMMPHQFFDEHKIRLALGEESDLEEIKEGLSALGYERTEIVENRGEFSVRGGILDVFTPSGDHPFRVEFFGDEIDSIRSFDEDTQRSIENLSFIEIYPAEQILADRDAIEKAVKNIDKSYKAATKRLLAKGDEFAELAEHLDKRRLELTEYVENQINVQFLENYVHYFYDENEYLWDYMMDGQIVVDDPVRICEHLQLREQEIKNDFDVLLERGQVIPEDALLINGKEDFFKLYERDRVYVLTPFQTRIEGADKIKELIKLDSRQMTVFNGRMDMFASEVNSYLDRGYDVTITASSKERLESLEDFAERSGFRYKVRFKEGTLSAGMDFPQRKVCYISDNDIFTSYKISRKKSKKSKSQQIQTFSDMKPGDYVVHENHGIGKFEAIVSMTKNGETKDYVKIRYAGEDMLFVPVDHIDLVQKYIGGDGSAPKINKLSNNEWRITKEKAKAAIAEMAEDLIELYAKRKMEKGYAFEPDTVWQKEFEDSFPYEEIGDQLRSIEEIKADMEKPVAMDRLLCGDVGFGKTEVAARAIFKCIIEGKQAAVLVPTTILANQHYHTLKERMDDFAFNVEMLSRFRTEGQQQEIISKVKKGQIDLLIGTHRMLSDDVQFKDLGLLVIDEEQRFGVSHKEKIKKLKANVDVLTLSATPIPRTLNMSLTGIKDMSLIEEPPEERYPVQTYVVEEDDVILREIINRELDRGGQVFIVFNRVKGINKLAERISHLCEDAKVIVGHGQMNEHMLEDVMMKFIDGDYNVLVSTTIIESGIDIPNANTMIVIDSDRFGLSQLYQLRGRVGRSNRMAYCYLMYKKDKILSEVAEKRLKAIKEFTEFGSGFKIAMRDLEIRGAGNLLGSQQSGHIMNIGYELYCKLVDEAVKRAKGEPVMERTEEFSVELKANANIPSWYISNDVLKLQMYKKIATVETAEDEAEITDELLDRFGDLPAETENLIKISRIRYMAEKMNVARLYEQQNTVVLSFPKENRLSGYAIMKVTEAFGREVFVHGGVEPFIRLDVKIKDKLDKTVKLLEILVENIADNLSN